MVFGISYTGILVLTASGLYLIGAKDLPRVARQLGVVTGRAVAYVSAIRRQALSFADETEISKMHRELQASMQQLQALRTEMRSGINVFKDQGGNTARYQTEQSGNHPMKSAQIQRSAADSVPAGNPARPQTTSPKSQGKGGTRLGSTLMNDLLQEEIALNNGKRSS